MATAAKRNTKATEATSRPKAAEKSDALAKLKEDHTAVRKLFDKYEKSKDEMSEGEKKAMVTEICMELTVHAQIEEEIFYPEVRDAADEELDELLDEAEVEHTGAKDLVAQLESANPSDVLYDAKVTVLGEQVKHHAEEEEKEMFPKVRKTDIDLQAVGEDLIARSDELKDSYPKAKQAAN
jgi:hemerythrin superfamily protein